MVGNSSDDPALNSTNFSPSDYIRDRLRGVRVGDEVKSLRALRSEMHSMHSASQQLLNNHVFHNYQQFIDAANEISQLEREIYQLSSMVLDQRALLEKLMQMTGEDTASIRTSSSHSTAPNTNPIQLLVQKIDGIAPILNNIRSSDRVVIHGEMDLLDPDTMQFIQKSYLVLLTDRLLIASQNNSGKFTIESTFTLNNVAAVNVKDRRGTNNEKMIKLLLFPDQRLYQCESARMKKQWLEEVENAKRMLLQEGNLVRQATIRGRRKTVQDRAAKMTSLKEHEASTAEHERQSTVDETDLEWLRELPAELDDCLAHRDVEHAVELIEEWKKCKTKDTDIDAQLQIREHQIVQMLSEDVRRPGAVHGGPRAMKKARVLLSQLGRGNLATDLYLKRRSVMLRTTAKDVAVSEEPLSYVRQLCLILSTNFSDVITEYNSMPQYYCQMLQWCSGELSMVCSLIKRHVIEVAPTIGILSYTWKKLRETMESLKEIGLDLTFELNRLLLPALKSALETNFQNNIMQTIKLQLVEERFRPSRLESEAALNRLVEEMSDLGIDITFAIDMTQTATLHISFHSLQFTKTSVNLAKDLRPLLDSPLRELCEQFMIDLWSVYLQHLSQKVQEGRTFAHSAIFIINNVMEPCEKAIFDDGDELRVILKKYPNLLPYLESTDEEDDEELSHV